MSDWRVLIGRVGRAGAQMAADERLAQEERLTVRLFPWDPPAVSLGFKQPRPEWVQRLPEAGIEWVGRPTGGGMALHGTDLSVAVVVPRELALPLGALMGAVCESAARLCSVLGVKARMLLDVPPQRQRSAYCLTEDTPYSLHISGRKVAGFALRRYPRTWLIQGSILVRPSLPASLVRVLPVDVVEGLRGRAVSLAQANGASLTELEVAEVWARHWSAWWEAALLERVGVLA